MKIKTKSGFVCDVDPERAKDWRFCKALAQCDSEDESTMIKGITFVVPFLLGDEGEQKLIEHLSNEKKIAPVDKVISEFKNILEKMGEETKKLQSSQG